MTDDRFERELRAFLAAREPRSVSPVLRARLQAVTAEPPLGVGVLAGRLRDAWRAAVGVAVTAVLAVVVVAMLARTDGLTLTDRGPGPVGGPSSAPVIPAVPFVTAPTDFFSAVAAADADRRLAALYASSGIEGRLIVRNLASVDELSTPPGWPDGWRADRNVDADVIAILGMTPDGTVTCCLTTTGSLIERAQEEGYWRPASWPDRLEGQLESDDQAVRDTALDRFVRGIEALEPGIAMIRVSIEREATLRQFVTVLVGLGMLGVFLFVTWSRWSTGRARLATDEGAVVGTTRVAAGAVSLDPEQPTLADVPVPGAAPVPWTSAVRNAGPGDRRLVAAAFAALAGVLALGAWDLVRPSAAGVPLDVSAATVGLASPVLPVVPLTLLATAVVALLMVARGGGWRRRLTVGALIGLVGFVGWWAFDGSRPTTNGSWIAGRGAGGIERGGGGLFDAQTYPLQPDAPFTLGMTVRNRGALPLTILGLDGVQHTAPNPYVATIVGLGSVEQSTGDGFVTTLSARPEDTTVAWPSTLAPGEEMAIVLLGRAGPCAEPAGTGSGLPLLHVQLTYRVLGIERSESVGLPVAVFVPEKATCTVDVPGGTVTYSDP